MWTKNKHNKLTNSNSVQVHNKQETKRIHVSDSSKIIPFQKNKIKQPDGTGDSTLTPSSLTGIICPGTMQSGPAASTMASSANPLPIGFGCCKIPRKEKIEFTIYRIGWTQFMNDRKRLIREKRKDLHNRESVVRIRGLRNSKNRWVMNFWNGPDVWCSPWDILLKRRSRSFLRHFRALPLPSLNL